METKEERIYTNQTASASNVARVGIAIVREKA